ncbi:MAG TPA: hypothetical protein VGA99_05850 [bacterium]
MRILSSLIWFLPVMLLAQTEPADVWEPLRHFPGQWTGAETGKSGIGDGERTYEFIMNGRYLYFKNKSVFKPQEKNPQGEVHEDWTFYSYDRFRKMFVMRQFNIEGFVNQFVLDSLAADGKTLVFVSESVENAPSGFRARMTYRIVAADEFNETFELAPPGQEFSIYTENHWKRRE